MENEHKRLFIKEDIHDLTTLSSEMCKAGLQASKEGIRTYLKSQGYKSKVPKEVHEPTYIQKKSEVV